MAYSNYGAFVYENGKRRQDREDVPAFGDSTIEINTPSGLRIFANLIKHGDKKPEEWERCYHAVLGNGLFRLCAYKSWPVLFIVKDDGKIVELEIFDYQTNGPKQSKESWDWHDSYGIEGEYQGYKFKAWPCDDPEAVELELIEPDGTKWSGKSGYGMGAGYE